MKIKPAEGLRQGLMLVWLLDEFDDEAKFKRRKNVYVIMNHQGKKAGSLSIDTQGEIRIKLEHNYCLSISDLIMITEQVQTEILVLIDKVKKEYMEFDAQVALYDLDFTKKK